MFPAILGHVWMEKAMLLSLMPVSESNLSTNLIKRLIIINFGISQKPLWQVDQKEYPTCSQSSSLNVTVRVGQWKI